MKTILYMAITVNGKIAGTNDDTSWTSKEDWDGFRAICRKVGNAVIGRRTYEMVIKEGMQLSDILTVVMTHDPRLLAKHSPDTIFTDKSPKDVIAILKEKGFKEALVCGGGILNSSFLKEGIIDEIYIDIEPLILGRGIPLFADGDFQPRLKLLEVKTLTNRQTVQLHYKVIK
ncbi:MAG: dihydrofolate reductase [Candidatus Pacebacteria bacterium]|nr:dihydrofolate reductase [Candidatus Paceibacterota bacterium]